MRDNHDQLPEIVKVFERNSQYFAVIGVTLSSETRQFEIGLNRDAYDAIKRILQTRPFDQMPGVTYRYFFVPSVRRLDNGMIEADFRIERSKTARQFRFEVPETLAAHLMWFLKLEDFTAASHLACVHPT